MTPMDQTENHLPPEDLINKDCINQGTDLLLFLQNIDKSNIIKCTGDI